MAKIWTKLNIKKTFENNKKKIKNTKKWEKNIKICLFDNENF